MEEAAVARREHELEEVEARPTRITDMPVDTDGMVPIDKVVEEQ